MPTWLGAAPAIQFGPVTHYTNNIGIGVDGICTGDFNGDTHLDLATIDNQRLTLWTNDGAGGFAVRTNYLAGGTPRVVVAGDLNNDGKLDFLTANYTGDSLSAFLGNGNGTFNRVDTSVSVNDGMPGLAVGDFNGDGKLDAALATYGIKILLGNGNGTFTLFTNYSGGTAYAVAVADFNGDHKLDLVTANYSSSSMSVYLGNGDGTFAAPTNYSGDFSEYHCAVAIGDFSNDGKPDLAAINYYNNSASVRLNNGDGTFGPETKYKVIFGPQSAAVGDFNHDGNLDIVAGQASSPAALAILPGNGNGTFGTALTNFTGFSGTFATESLAVGDFDGDGLVDLATTRGTNNAVSVRLNLSVALLQVAPVAGQIRLSWPNWTGYLLEGSTNLLDTSSWVTVTNAPVLIGSQKALTNSITGNSQFYRLRKPLP